MAGSRPANLHEGSRSEILADYLFSMWGTVTPTRVHDDYGVDLSCTLTERIGQRARVRDYFSVQVKSTDAPWKFKDKASVKWLVEHPVPLFLCTVSKRQGIVRVYHLMPRFFAWAMGTLPNRLELKPGQGNDGTFVLWENGSTASLSAPIIEAHLGDFIDKSKMDELGKVFWYWVRIDRDNCDLVRQGLLRFRMPMPYKTNVIPTQGIGEMGLAAPEQKFLARGIERLAEAVQCIGGQLGQLGDLAFALDAAMLLDRMQKGHKKVFKGNLQFRDRVPGLLGRIVNSGLNRAFNNNAARQGEAHSNYQYIGLDAVEKALANDPIAKEYLSGDLSRNQMVVPRQPQAKKRRKSRR